jgi:phosphatidylglycerophosphate synthase
LLARWPSFDSDLSLLILYRLRPQGEYLVNGDDWGAGYREQLRTTLSCKFLWRTPRPVKYSLAMSAGSETIPSSTASEAVDLLIDAREPTLDPATHLLGLSLLRRLVLAARRAGFTAQHIVAASDDEAARFRTLVAGIQEVRVTTSSNQAHTGQPTIPADTLGEVESLKALAERGDATALHRVMDTVALDAARSRLLGALVKKTDGFMSRHFARPISIFVSRRIVNWGVTPNQMTIVSMLIGLAGAPFFLSDTAALQTIGALLFVTHSVLDGCDGELARLTYRESRLGGILDFIGDNLVHIAIFGCMGWGWYMAGDSPWPLYLGISAVIGAAGSAFAVYGLTLRTKEVKDRSATGPVYTSVAGAGQQSARLTKLLDDLSRRDFIYLVFALSLFGKAAWFLALAGFGAPIFLLLVLVVAWRERRS